MTREDESDVWLPSTELQNKSLYTAEETPFADNLLITSISSCDAQRGPQNHYRIIHSQWPQRRCLRRGENNMTKL
ncbi:hypothetical protein AMEX_G15651 [Astyanax mexicanus]|uniref:Uncharacterized protein n=1 Tax=Astyanax mexicanus TaxID=7994 RepID=A0A8T2LIE1_ASTMX|nr:hypothetical protein AMEX_G15651 [Astyanax mexicanus]